MLVTGFLEADFLDAVFWAGVMAFAAPGFGLTWDAAAFAEGLAVFGFVCAGLAFDLAGWAEALAVILIGFTAFPLGDFAAGDFFVRAAFNSGLWRRRRMLSAL